MPSTGGQDLKRRIFIAAAAAAGSACRRSASPWRFFTVHEADLATALTERLIPRDSGPGATDAGVVNYIDRQLTLKYKRHQPTYRETLRKLDEQGFLSMTPQAQDALLADWEKGPDRPTFDLILAHTMQGFYGSPRHGGNRDAVSWRMLGVPTIPVRGRLHYTLPPIPEKR